MIKVMRHGPSKQHSHRGPTPLLHLMRQSRACNLPKTDLYPSPRRLEHSFAALHQSRARVVDHLDFGRPFFLGISTFVSCASAKFQSSKSIYPSLQSSNSDSICVSRSFLPLLPVWQLLTIRAPLGSLRLRQLRCARSPRLYVGQTLISGKFGI